MRSSAIRLVSGHQHSLVLGRTIANLSQKIVHLASGGAHLHHWIQHPRRADNLIGHLAAACLHLPIPGWLRRKRSDGLLPELLTLQWAVVSRAGQANRAQSALSSGPDHRCTSPAAAAGDVALVHDRSQSSGK